MQGLSNEIRIFGPPGCGKTTKLKELITEEAVENDNTESIVIASFTKAAAAVLIERNLPLSEDHVGTLHSHAYRLLGSPEVASSKKKVAAFNDAHPELAIAPDEVDAIENPGEITLTVGEANPGQASYLAYQNFRARLTPRELWPISVRDFATKWEDFKAMIGMIDFTDMIEFALDVPERPFGARVGFFDEVQDFSPLELKLVRKWAEGMDVCYLAGDDDQAIYSFRGADPDAFLNPPLPDAQKIILSQSYRVPRVVHEMATTFVETIAPREPKPYLPRETEGALHYAGFHIYDDLSLLRAVRRDLDAGQSVMVIAACGYMLNAILKKFREHGIPFHNPYSPKRWKWNPLSKMQKLTGANTPGALRVLNFFMPRKDIFGDEAKMWTYHALHSWVHCLDAKCCARGAKTEIEKIAKQTPGETVTRDELVRWFPHERTIDAIVDGDLHWFRQSLTGTYDRSLDYVIRIADNRVQDLRDEPRVTVGSIHSVKGGQSDSVYFSPDLSPSGYADTFGSTHGLMATRRQAYVAMTRAKEKLTILSPATQRHMEL